MIFKRLQFDDIDSLEQGVYITGEAVYNSPERDVELVTIPGRNGDLILDRNRFQNIEVTYPAGAKKKNAQSFQEVIREFRNLLASKRGYKKLADDYNPDEYRMGVFKDAIEVEATGSQNAGEFELVFNCKPQRFLMSGDSAVSVSDGDEIFNPTPFDASPILILEGVGSIRFNGYEITIENNTVGDAVIVANTSKPGNKYVADFSDVYVATGNTIDMSGVHFGFDVFNRDEAQTFTSYSISNITGSPQILPNATGDGSFVYVQCNLDDETFTYGTPATQTIGFDLNVENTNVDTATVSVSVSVNYDGNKRIEFSANIGYIPYAFTMRGSNFTFVGLSSVVVHSTAFTYGNPTYIDCDIGEAYAIDNGIMSLLNRYIALGSKLPVLGAGNNLIEYDNTFTDVQIIPRWWVV